MNTYTDPLARRVVHARRFLGIHVMGNTRNVISISIIQFYCNTQYRARARCRVGARERVVAYIAGHEEASRERRRPTRCPWSGQAGATPANSSSRGEASWLLLRVRALGSAPTAAAVSGLCVSVRVVSAGVFTGVYTGAMQASEWQGTSYAG